MRTSKDLILPPKCYQMQHCQQPRMDRGILAKTTQEVKASVISGEYASSTEA